MQEIDYKTVDIAFGLMADEYDLLQYTNEPVKKMRNKFYEVIFKVERPPADILELNCGTGIDAHLLAEKGYNVTATDISSRMLENAMSKGSRSNLRFIKMNFTQLGELDNGSFDLIISNLGGMNCIDDPGRIKDDLFRLLRSGGYFIITVMPAFSLWEFALLLKGQFERGLRRMKRMGVFANVGGKKIFVKYHSPAALKKIYSGKFELRMTKALCVFSPPPPFARWYYKHPNLVKLMDKMDNFVENNYFFSFLGDYYIAVFKKSG